MRAPRWLPMGIAGVCGLGLGYFLGARPSSPERRARQVAQCATDAPGEGRLQLCLEGRYGWSPSEAFGRPFADALNLAVGGRPRPTESASRDPSVVIGALWIAGLASVLVVMRIRARRLR